MPGDNKSQAVAGAMSKRKTTTVTSAMKDAQTRAYHEEMSQASQMEGPEQKMQRLRAKYPLADTSPYYIRGKSKF